MIADGNRTKLVELSKMGSLDSHSPYLFITSSQPPTVALSLPAFTLLHTNRFTNPNHVSCSQGSRGPQSMYHVGLYSAANSSTASESSQQYGCSIYMGSGLRRSGVVIEDLHQAILGQRVLNWSTWGERVRSACWACKECDNRGAIAEAFFPSVCISAALSGYA